MDVVPPMDVAPHDPYDVSAALGCVNVFPTDSGDKSDDTGLHESLNLSDSGIYSPSAASKKTTLRHPNDSDSGAEGDAD